jgi:hypothetical protein
MVDAAATAGRAQMGYSGLSSPRRPLRGEIEALYSTSKEPVMSLFAGLDISVKTTAICVLDANGRVLLETMVDSAPEAIAGRLHEFGQPFERIGLEAGPLSQWIYAGLVDVGLAAICVETRHMHAALSARIRHCCTGRVLHNRGRSLHGRVLLGS